MKERNTKIKERNIKKQHKREEKTDLESLKSLLIVLVVIGVLFSALILTLKFSSKQKKGIEFNNFLFYKKSKWWQTFVSYNNKNFEVLTYYYPPQLFDVRIQKGVDSVLLNSSKVFITTNPNYSVDAVIAATEIAKVLGKIFGKQVHGAYTVQSSKDITRPVITCANATKENAVLLLEKVNYNAYNNTNNDINNNLGVFRKGYCVIIIAPSEKDMIKVADALVFRIFKIM